MASRVVLCLAALLTVAMALPSTSISGCKSECQEKYQIPAASDESGSPAADSGHPCTKGCSYFVLRESSRPTSEKSEANEGNLSGCNADCQEAYKDENERSQCNAGCSFGSSQLKSESKEDEMEGRGMSFRIAVPSFFSSFGNLDDGLGSFPGFGLFDNNGRDRMDEMENRFKKVLGSFRDGIDQRLDDVKPPMQTVFKNVQDAFEEMATRMNPPPAIPFLNSEPAKVGTNVSVQPSSPPSSIGDFMADQLSGMMKWTKNIFNSDSIFGDLLKSGDLPKGSNGKLVVIKSGPGFHEEKSYNIDTDTDISQILKDDMMNVPNPLDDVNSKDVEVFDPKVVSTGNTENKDDDGGNMNIQVFGPLELPYDPFMNNEDEEITDNMFEGPLSRFRPAEIDESPFLGHNIVLVDICSQKPSQMTWSQWFTCLHVKVGISRWLMAATICSGIIFAIWLCLIIPTNMSKKKNRKNSKKSIGVKELEASANPHASIIALDRSYPLDLPPSYDDVACIKAKPEKDAQEPSSANGSVALPPPGQV